VILCVLCGESLSSRLPAADCNLNNVEDTADIEAGVSEDCNSNGIPDACEVVPLIFGTVGGPLHLDGDPRLLASADLDGDGRDDVIVGIAASIEAPASMLRVFSHLERPDDASEVVLFSPGLAAVATSDLDGDGALDLVTANGDVLQVHLNSGEAGFAAPALVQQVLATAGTADLVIVDVDLDGRSDIVTLSPSEGSLSWYCNVPDPASGEPNFDLRNTFPVVEPLGNTTRARLFLEAADFDRDGDPDLALAGGRELAVSILRNNDAGASFEVIQSFQTGGLVTGFQVGDVDTDGFVDVVAATTRGAVNVWRQEEGVGFAEPLVLRLRGVESLVLSDTDDDGTLDLLLGGRDVVRPTITILRGGGDGAFHAPEFLSVEDNLFSPVDVDGDSDVDVAVASTDLLNLFLQGERQGLVLDGTSFFAHGEPHFLDVGHFNNDGVPDIVTAHNDGTFSVFFGRGDGTLQWQAVRNLGEILPAVVAVDLNADRADDLVFNARGRLLALLNQGDGEFGNPTAFPSLDNLLELPNSLAKADVDGDGHVDVLVPGWGPDVVAVHFSDGRGGLDEQEIVRVGTFPWTVAAGDLDSDGDADLVTANGPSSEVALVFQEGRPRGERSLGEDGPRGSRSFAPPVSVPVEGEPFGVALGDLDGDGDLDVVVARQEAADAAVLLNAGDGAMGRVAGSFPLRERPVATALADLDQDGFLDAAITHVSGGVSVLRGRGDGTFSRAQHFPTGATGALHTVSADMDADGDPDLMVANRNGLDVFVFLNQVAVPVPLGEFVPAICTPLDFERVSVPDGTTDSAAPSERRTRFLLPARDDPDLLASLYQNVARFPLALDFLRQVFPERFGDLTVLGFADLALRRARRDYFSGAVRLLRLADGSVAYGFEVHTDPGDAAELLSIEETGAVRTRLLESFHLKPLLYLPMTPEARAAARQWVAPDFSVLLPDVVAPGPEGNPTFRLEIAADTILCNAFGLRGPQRGPRQERAWKSRVHLRAGTVELPTESATFSRELFESVQFGPERLPAKPSAAGIFRVVRVAPGQGDNDVATYRFTYAQPFITAGGRLLELEIVTPLVFRARGDEPLAETQSLPTDFFVTLNGREPLQARLDGDPLVRYGSCTYESLPLWTVNAELADGTRIRIAERFEETSSEFDTAPARVVRANVLLVGEERNVSDDFDLIYSSVRHNRAVDYWVILDPPVIAEVEGAVHAVELRAPESFPSVRRDASASYLNGDYEVLATRTVTSFARSLVGEPVFLRGDAGGDGALDFTDAIRTLRYLFEGADEIACLKAADANDDGRINIVDPIAVISVLFGRGDALPDPFPRCDRDPTEDGLSCRSSAPCP
jgi:hypothetical protein